MSAGSRSKGNLVLGGIALLGIAGICYYWWSRNTKSKKLSNSKSDLTSKQGEVGENDNVSGIDGKDSDALKAAYDDATRLAVKLLNGKSYVRAAEKYTEAIDLAQQLPSVAKDILTLYNNRSAMYEKLGEYEKSMNDITVVLALDGTHIKARTRRSRIYEAQGKMTEALDELVVVMFIEQGKNLQPSAATKTDEIAKKVAKKEAEELIQTIRENETTTNKSEIPFKLPIKSYCRNFFDSLPSIHRWREQYKGKDRDEFSSVWNTKAWGNIAVLESMESTLVENALSNEAELGLLGMMRCV